MPPLVQAVHDKVKNFVRNSDQFKRVCESTFEALDYRSAGKVSVDDAASCVEALFRELQSACSDYGIVLDPLTSDDVRKIFRVRCDYDSNAVLDKSEFTDFYSAVVTYAAMRAAAGFGRRYGLGMLAGVAGVVVAKSALRRLPVVGAVASPLLGPAAHHHCGAGAGNCGSVRSVSERPLRHPAQAIPAQAAAHAAVRALGGGGGGVQVGVHGAKNSKVLERGGAVEAWRQLAIGVL
eukprot:XP_001690832.1 predicted protein [Chlamydomonas reinhardtii]